MTYTVKKWGEVLQIINGKNQKAVANDQGKYPIYGSGGIIGRANDFLCESGTTIIGRKGTINNPIFVNEPFWNVDTAFGIVPGEELLPKYLFYFCCLFDFRVLDKSTTLPSLTKRDLLGIKMPVPTLEKQQNIVDRIEEMFSNLDKSTDLLQIVRRQMIAYRQSVLKEIFSHLEPQKTIREMSSLVTSGSRGWAKYYSSAGAMFIRIGNLTRTDIRIDLTDIQRVDLPDKAEGIRSHLQPNDVLVSITADLGSIGLVPEEIEEAYINQHIAMIRFNKPRQGRFMAWYLRSEYGQKDLLKNKRGGGKLGLGLDDIRDAKVPNISDIEAEQIVGEIELRLSVCDRIEQSIGTIMKQTDAMRLDILKQTFEGSWV